MLDDQKADTQLYTSAHCFHTTTSACFCCTCNRKRIFFFPFLLPQFFSVFLESLALRLWEKFPQSKLSDRDFYAFTSALQVGSFDLSSSVLILSCNPCVFGVPQLGIQEVFHIHLDSEILIIYPPEV